MDKQVAQYSNLYSWLLWPTVRYNLLSLKGVEEDKVRRGEDEVGEKSFEIS